MSKINKRPTVTKLVSFIKASKRPIRCITCSNERVAQICIEYIKLRSKGKVAPWQSWRWLCHDYMNKQLGLKVKTDTVMNHVRHCLGWSNDK